jgi:hypothetical protein
MALFIGITIIFFWFSIRRYNTIQKGDLFIFSVFLALCGIVWFCIKYFSQLTVMVLLSILLYKWTKQTNNKKEEMSNG